MLIITRSQLHKIFDFLPSPAEGNSDEDSGSQRTQGARTNGPIAGNANWLLSTHNVRDSQIRTEKVGKEAGEMEKGRKRELVTKDESLARRNPFQC